jgi:hypothetical protein
MVTRKDYNKLTVEAAKSVLLELIHLLGAYRDHIVLIGGWVPEFIISSTDNPHIGSIDVDIAFNHLKIRKYPPENQIVKMGQKVYRGK